jgi:ubiquinone/menaquinone biosynthesis C-methylase UbiE
MFSKKCLNPNVKEILKDNIKAPYVLDNKGSKLVYDYNKNLSESYFEHLEFPVSLMWYDYFSEKMLDANISSGGKALDVCTGTGTLVLNLMQRKFFDKCIAIDISQPAINILQKRIKQLSLSKTCEAKCDNIMNTSFADNEFDFVIGNSFLHHLPDNKAFLKEMKRILKPSGRICFTGEPTISCSALEGFFLGNLIKILKFFRIKSKNKNETLSDIWSYEKNSISLLLSDLGYRDIKIVPFGFFTAIFNEPTSFIISKLTKKSMQPVIYWKIMTWIDKTFFSWINSNYNSHFIISAKK